MSLDHTADNAAEGGRASAYTAMAQALRHGDDSVLVTDSMGVTQWANPAFLRLMGCEAADIAGHGVADVFRTACGKATLRGRAHNPAVHGSQRLQAD